MPEIKVNIALICEHCGRTEVKLKFMTDKEAWARKFHVYECGYDDCKKISKSKIKIR